MHDLIYCFRMLRKRPSFTVVAVLTLALAIGASTALFSIVNVVILNPFPYKDPSRLFFVRQSLPQIGVQDQLRASGPEFIDLAKSGIFERVAAFEPVSRNLTGSDEPERVGAAKVSTDFFTALGVEPLIGRTIAAKEQGPSGQRVLVISHGLWQRRFGGDHAVLGQKVLLDDEAFTIIGVMPPQFRFDEAQAWFPFPFDFNEGSRAGRSFPILARTSSGTTVEQVNAALANLARQNEHDFLSTNQEYAGRGIRVQPLAEFYFGPVRRTLLILMGAVTLVLLIACANIANLLLAKSMSRAHEIAIRKSMGASGARIVRQMLIESAVLGLLGGVLGLLMASWGTRLLFNLIPAGTIPTGLEVTMNVPVLLFALGVSLATAFIFGLWPAIQGSRTQPREVLQATGQRATASVTARRAQSALVVAEIGLSLILLVMAGLMIRSVAKLTNIDPGMSTANVMSMRINRSAIQAAIREVDKDQPVYQIQTIDELIRDSVGTRRFALTILILFAVLALVLAVSGIYGVISYSVTQRTQEIGIRMALGAKGPDVLRLVLVEFMRLTVVGVALGLVAAYALTRLMTSLLFGVTATDVTTFVLVSISLTLVAIIACLIPAWRATRVDPLVALRYE